MSSEHTAKESESRLRAGPDSGPTSTSQPPVEVGDARVRTDAPNPGAGDPASASDLPRRFSQATSEEIDPQLVRETRSQIQGLVQEIRELADSDCDRQEFFQGFLSRVASALASTAGAIWNVGPDGKLKLEYQINFPETGLRSEESLVQHGRLLEQLLQKGQPELIQPHAGCSPALEPDVTGSVQAANPTEHLLVVGMLSSGEEVDGLVEIFQRPGGGPTTQRGYLRFLAQMSELASSFLKNQRLKDFSSEREAWGSLEQFVRNIHNSLEVRQTLYNLANEGRRYTGCDRVSIALSPGRHCKVQVISGLDTIERRAAHVKQLNRLVNAAVKTGDVLWYSGETSELAPQIESRLQDYLDQSHSKSVVILPLLQVPRNLPAAEQQSIQAAPQRRPRVIGAIVFEQLSNSVLERGVSQRIEVASRHSCDALSNALAHESLFLMPLWKALGHVPGAQAVRRTPGWLIAACILAAICIGLIKIPYEFSLGAKGSLIPGQTYEVFAPLDGKLVDVQVPADPLALVEPQQLLATMSNSKIEVEIKDLEGKLDAELEQQKKLRHATLDKSLTRMEAEELQGEISKSEVRQNSIRRQLQLWYADRAKLEIRAPGRGYVVNWQLRQNLIRRPVKTGHHLMTIVDPDTEWELELELPERRLNHVLQYQQSQPGEPITASFTLASQPDVVYVGEVKKIDRQFDVYSDSGNAILVRVAFDNAEVPADLLRSGTRVTCKIHCGQKSSGYVLFHELIETVRTNVLFWF